MSKWTLFTDKKGNRGITDNNFTHDVIFWVDGDFSDAIEEVEYCGGIIKQLNELSSLRAALEEKEKEYESEHEVAVKVCNELAITRKALEVKEEAFKMAIARIRLLSKHKSKDWYASYMTSAEQALASRGEGEE